jgi:hypothetical protein
LKLLSFKKMKHKDQDTFKNSYLFKNDEKKMSCTWKTINI